MVELEEQLKIVSLQRKKAEQATADVLAILAENGFNDVSDGYDSTSDQESYSQTSSGKRFFFLSVSIKFLNLRCNCIIYVRSSVWQKSVMERAQERSGSFFRQGQGTA